MDSKIIFDYIKKIENINTNNEKKVKDLEEQIEELKSIGEKQTPKVLKKNLKDSYSKQEITEAYEKMLIYEGLKDCPDNLITDTFFLFLTGTHPSMKKPRKPRTQKE